MYELYACMKKGASEVPRTHLRACKFSTFSREGEGYPQTPSHNLYYGPTFCICPGLQSSWWPALTSTLHITCDTWFWSGIYTFILCCCRSFAPRYVQGLHVNHCRCWQWIRFLQFLEARKSLFSLCLFCSLS